ncbi:MAG: lytic murein transglycosylase [Halorhodospira sp.]
MARTRFWPLAATWLPLVALSPAASGEAFEACVDDLREALVEQGHDPELVTETLDGVEQLERIIELDRQQPEFVQTFWEYLDARLTEERIEQGRAMLDAHEQLLWQLYADFGVSPRYLVALWGMETHYGSHFGEVPIVDAITTLVCEGRRESFFFEELEATVALLEDGRLEHESLRGSWAGAMGHTQFMPSTLREHAVDYDGSGHIDLRGSIPDALASAANYLRRIGWDPEIRWGREVQLTEAFGFEHLGLDEPLPLSEWQRLGVRRADGSDLPESDLEAALLLPMGRHGPAFLVYDNFRKIRRWNASTSYALAVGLLADRIDGQPGLQADRPDLAALRRTELKTVQEQLQARGYDIGSADGLLGPQTRTAIRSYQQEEGLPADGYPTRALLERLRREPSE